MIKKRTLPEKNYRGIYFNGKTFRIALDDSKPIKELDFPEFYDVKITDHCLGKCPYCYMDSKETGDHFDDIIEKTENFFGSLTKNQRPFQVAIGGGEPTSHPQFIELMKSFYELGITPNYTTNGMFIDNIINTGNIINATKSYCGGVAVSCHDQLKYYWETASNLFYDNNIKLNFHIVISDKESCDKFRRIFDEWEHKVDYFVLLPYGTQGRASQKDIEWDYLVSVMPDDIKKIAFGANFYNNLLTNTGRSINVSLYEPEHMSKFLDYKDMKMYRSSFSLNEEV